MNISSYILCGGKSSRMGTDKALQLLKGQTFLSYITKAITPITSSIQLVTSNPKHNNLGFKCITDIELEKGPVSAITSALSETNTPVNLILSCDIPLINQNLLNWLVENHVSSFDATIICHNKKQMPLVAVYHKRCLPTFKTHLQKNQLKLMTVLNDLNVNYLEVPKVWEAQLANINTVKQLNQIS